jgi:hypothetical protein
MDFDKLQGWLTRLRNQLDAERCSSGYALERRHLLEAQHHVERLKISLELAQKYQSRR